MAAYPRSANASATVGEPFALGDAQEHRAGESEEGQRAVVGGHGIHDGPRLHLVDRGGGVEGAVRLDVGDPGAGHPAHRLERAELVEHVGGEVGRVHVDAAAAEAGEVAVADLRADDDPALGGRGDGAPDGRRVAGVEAARDVGARHDVEHRLVVAEHPGAERLAEVGVEVDPHGHATNASARPARRSPHRAARTTAARMPDGGRGVRLAARRGVGQPMTVMFAACGPFAPCWVSYSTLAFSSSER